MSAKDLPLGLKQRLALACAVMHEPQALFLDEPTSGVDPITRREFWTHINGLVEKGVTVLVTTHFMDEAEYCDRISLIYRGRSIALGSPDELKARVVTPDNPDPTMEDAFIALVQGSEPRRNADERSGRMSTRPITSRRRFATLVRKETYQIVRDPEQHPHRLRAAADPALPVRLWRLARHHPHPHRPRGRGDRRRSPRILAASFQASRYFAVTHGRDRREFEEDLVHRPRARHRRHPADFRRRLRRRTNHPQLQVIVDGSDPNTPISSRTMRRARLPTGRALRQAESAGQAAADHGRAALLVQSGADQPLSSWCPGSIAIVMTLVGTLLTSLVVAREWERGTMEAMMATPVTATELLVGKIMPYFVLGLASMTLCVLLAVFVFGVPFRGSILALYALSAAFLIPALGQGLLISAATKNQFLASQLALLSAFLPAFLLSGFLFEIDSMPTVIQWIT